MKLDWIKILLAGGKFFVVALVGVIVAALTIATTGYTPDGPLNTVLWQYAVLPLIIAIIGALQNLIKHLNDKK